MTPEDLMTPHTPREFAMIDHIRHLERQLQDAARGNRINLSLTDDGASVRVPVPHPELLKVASLSATKDTGRWTVRCRAYDTKPNGHYNITEYIQAPEDNGWSTTEYLALIHQDFISKLAADLTARFGDVWGAYQNMGKKEILT